MFNLGFSELIVLGMIALIFIGPKQLPEVARTVGRLLNELRRATGDITGSFVKARDNADQMIRKTTDQVVKDVKSSVDVSVDLSLEDSKASENKKEMTVTKKTPEKS